MKIIASILSFLLAISSFACAADCVAEGDGSADNPYIIKDGSQMNILSEIINNGDINSANQYFKFDESMEENKKIEYMQNAHYKLSGDIDVDLTNGIGTQERPFKGTFDGNGFSINLHGETFDAKDIKGQYLAVFNYTENAKLYDIDVDLKTDIKIDNAQELAGISLLAGDMSGGVMDNCKIRISNNVINILSGGGGNFGVAASKISDAAEMRYIYIYIYDSGVKLANKEALNGTIFDCGLLCAKSDGNYETRNKISNIVIEMANSEFTAENLNVYMGGVAGEAKMTDISYAEVRMRNSSIGAAADSADMLSSYIALSVGGILGYSAPGSDNVNHIGNIGNTLSSCAVTSYNSKKRYVLYAHENTGGAPNTGGLVGCTFNNIMVADSEVNIENGTISAIRYNNNSAVAAYGPVAGGIIGRTEHTGRIYNTNVYGNNLTIEAKGTEKNIYAGGITGVDIGAIHKAQTTIEACNVYGNNTTEIVAESIFPEMYLGGTTYIGGIAGYSGGKIESCNVYGIELYTNTSVYKTASGTGYQNGIAGIVGFMEKAVLKDSTVDFETGIFSCSTNNVKINISGKYDEGIYCGGIAGRILGNINVRDCSSECEIETNTFNGYMGGLIGAAINGNNNITRCKAKAKIINADAETVRPIGTCGGVIGILSGENMNVEDVFAEIYMDSKAKYKGIFIGYHQYKATAKSSGVVCITDNEEPAYRSNSVLSQNVLNYALINTKSMLLEQSETKTVAFNFSGSLPQNDMFELTYDENVEQKEDNITITAVSCGTGWFRITEKETNITLFEKKIIVMPQEITIETDVIKEGEAYIFNIEYSVKPDSGILVTALYSENMLVGVNYGKCTDKLILTAESEPDTAKAFIWNDLNMMIPISNISVYKLK